jgi:hypothetical protein
MCNFSSFSLTKDSEIWWHTESHADIDEHWQLHVDGARGPNVLHVEITPPDDNPKAPLNQWVYRVDQDVFPEWHDPVESERRARAALARRSEKERWLVSDHLSDGAVSISGNDSTLTGGHRSTLTGGNDSTLTGGHRSTLVVRWWDAATERYRLAVGYVGENGIEPDKPYRWDSDKGRLVLAEPKP